MAVQHVNRVQLQDPNGKGENIFYNANVLFRNASLSLSHIIGRSDTCISQTSRTLRMCNPRRPVCIRGTVSNAFEEIAQVVKQGKSPKRSEGGWEGAWGMGPTEAKRRLGWDPPTKCVLRLLQVSKPGA